MAARTFTHEIAGKSVTIRQMTVNNNKVYRHWLLSEIGPASVLFSRFDEIAAMQDNSKEKQYSADDMKKMVGTISNLVDEAPSVVIDIICHYSPELAEMKDTLGKDAYDDELIEVAQSVVKLCFPLEKIRELMSGLRVASNSRSSPYQRGG